MNSIKDASYSEWLVVNAQLGDTQALERMGDSDHPFVLLLYCGYRYFAVDDLKQSLTWGLGIVLCGMSMVIVKVIAWQMMQTQVLIREVTRLELRLLSHGGMGDHRSS